MVSVRSMVAFGIGAFALLALAIMLTAFTLTVDDTKWTPWPTKVVFDWLLTVAPRYRFVAAAVLGCCGSAMAIAAARRYRAL